MATAANAHRCVSQAFTVQEYFAIGVRWVWIVEPKNRAVLVYRSVTEMQRLGEGDILVGEGVLEGFALPVANLFAG